MYNILVRFSWDEEKNRRNVEKHRVSFETAALVFEDPNALSIQDRFADGEQRWQTLGLVGGMSCFSLLIRCRKTKTKN